jgi:UDP-N-acetylmuramate dehydrogenase
MWKDVGGVFMADLPSKLLSIPHRRDVPFAKLTTLGLGGICRWLFEPTSEEEAIHFVSLCNIHKLEYKVLGGGSNLVVLSDIEMPVMRLRFPKELVRTSTGVYANASYGHAELVRDVAEMGLSGLEWAVGIPGSLGGALRMNAGAHGSDWGQMIDRIRFLTPDGEYEVEKRIEPGDFTYRSSFLGEDHVVMGASIVLTEGDADSIQRLMAERLEARQNAQPAGRSAGCIFKNPSGPLTAGQLIDRAGLKGRRIGGAVVSDLHANFILNEGNATPKDYWKLVKLVQAGVKDAHGVELELEVNVWKERRWRAAGF